MKILFVGPQGCGKGTQAKVIAEKFNIAHISTGDLLRNATGELKKEVDTYMLTGKLVPDELMLRVLKERISQHDCNKGFILDGYPRNITQAHELDKITRIDKVIEIEISDQESVRRLGGRLSCKNCGAVFNENTHTPKRDMQCDNCDAMLIKRADDTKEAILKRLDIYHSETEPILKHYHSVKINGEQPIDQVTKDIIQALK
jgi:adenylate kinase